MEELFGVSMNHIMVVLLVIFLVTMACVAYLASRNRILVKLALRNIPRRRAQTALIIVGIMLSSIITAAAFGTGDTISHSIRTEAVELFGPIDVLIISARSGSEDAFNSPSYFPQERFNQLVRELEGFKSIDGLTPGIGETVPAVNTRTNLSEGRMRVAGIDPTSLQGFGSLILRDGRPAPLEDLAEGEAYINSKAAKELDARAGDRLRLLLGGEPVFYTVKAEVERGGLAGPDPTMALPLEQVQKLFGREGQINSIAVSNLGDRLSGADLSEEVARKLRLQFSDREVAGALRDLLDQEAVLDALQKREDSLDGDLRDDLRSLSQELQVGAVSDKLISLLADKDISDELLEALEPQHLDNIERQATTLFADLGEFRVVEIKRSALDTADEIASGVTTFFIILGLFSIMVGILLIFLIFVMLAAARRVEMGMARAVGAKRFHLMQMFIFEGTTYALASAAIGVAIGLGVSALIVVVANQFIGTFEEDFTFTHHFEIRSVIVAYCLGMVITFATVAFSSYRISRMNIVAAVRGQPETFAATGRSPFKARFVGLLAALVRPFYFAFRGLSTPTRNRTRAVRNNLGLAILWGAPIWLAILAVGGVIPGNAAVFIFIFGSMIWVIDILAASFRFLWPYLRRGWLTLVLGVLITWGGVDSDEASLFRIGVTLTIIGLGLVGRTILERSSLRADVVDRVAFTFIGVLNLVFYMLPFSSLRAVAGDLEGGPEMFFISGISMVAAAVWTVMYNADLLLRAMTFLTGRIGRMRPVLVTAVAYPMSAKFRTGLTLAMFALVIFTLIVVSILTEAFNTTPEDLAIATGGWQIEGTVNGNTPISDIRGDISDSPILNSEDFTAIGGYTLVPLEARQVGAENQRWEWYAARAADNEFLGATDFKLKLIANGYGPTNRDVWAALQEDPSLAVVDALVVPSRSGFNDSEIPFQMEGFKYEDNEMDPIPIEVRQPAHRRHPSFDSDRCHGPPDGQPRQYRLRYGHFKKEPGRCLPFPGASDHLPVPAG